MARFPEDFIQRVHPAISGATQWTLSDADDNMLFSVVGGGTGIYGDGVRTFEMYDSNEGDVVLQYATAEEINDYLSKLEE